MLACWAASLVSTMQLILHTLVLLNADGPSEVSGVSLVPARTTFEKLWRSGHLMVPVWSVGHMNMFGALLVAVGRHRSPRSIEATSLHACVEVHVLVQCPACHVSSTGHAGRLACVGLLSHITRLDHAAHLKLVLYSRWFI